MAVKDIIIEPAKIKEAEQPPLRRSDRPLQVHVDLAKKYAEHQQAIEEMNAQFAAMQKTLQAHQVVTKEVLDQLKPILDQYEKGIIIVKDIALMFKKYTKEAKAGKVVYPPSTAGMSYKEVLDFADRKIRSLADPKALEEWESVIRNSFKGTPEKIWVQAEKLPKTESVIYEWSLWRKIADRFARWMGRWYTSAKIARAQVARLMGFEE